MIRRLFGSPRATRSFFDRIGLPYRWITNNLLWRDSLREMARHFPPSASELRLLDVGCGPGNSALQLLEYRPDLCITGIDFSSRILEIARKASEQQQDRTAWMQADAIQLPFADNSYDAITAHALVYMLPNPTAFLQESLRVLRPGGRLIMLNPSARRYPFGLITKAWRSRSYLSLMIWHTVATLHQHYTLESTAKLLTDAGYARVLAECTVEGYGILGRGEKPYAQLATVERIALTSARESTPDELQVVAPDTLETTIKGRFVYLLVRQLPDKPAWALKPDEPIRWRAALLNDDHGKSYLLAFSSLNKAVEFMQAAVTNNTIQGINKVAKYPKVVIGNYATDLLLNPSFELVCEHYSFTDIMLDVDPHKAVTGEE